MIIWNYYDMAFDGERFNQDIKQAVVGSGATLAEWSEEMGFNQNYLAKQGLNGGMPTIRNFVIICNVFALNPQHYWIIA